MAAIQQAGTRIRPIRAGDATALHAFVLRNREALAPWEPARPDRWFTLEGQVARAHQAEDAWDQGRGYAFVIVVAGAVAGLVELSAVVRGPFRNAYLGYSLDHAARGRGHATRAVRMALGFAFGEAGLHRVQAAVMPGNRPSVAVLERVGFRREGLALRYLEIDGVWRDHLLFALTQEEWPTARPPAAASGSG